MNPLPDIMFLIIKENFIDSTWEGGMCTLAHTVVQGKSEAQGMLRK